MHTRENVGVIDEALREATEIAGDRWVLLALAGLSDGSRRFGDLLNELPGIAPNVLIDRLRRMERHGLVVANPYTHRPRRYVYDLTESGRDLAALLPALANWASRRTGGEPRRHTVCGTAVEIRDWCPTCRMVVDDSGADESLRWV